MVRQFDDISRAIGAIEGKLDSLTRQTSDDLTAIREQMRSIMANIDRLPPSPSCVAEHRRLHEEITSIKVGNARHLGFASGLAATASIAIQWLLSQAGLKF